MRASMVLFVGLLTLLAAGERCPGAEPKQEPRHAIGAELTVINQCVREVRQSAAGSEFDAHVGAQGAMRYIGTEVEISAFKRCMQMKGFSVDPE